MAVRRWLGDTLLNAGLVTRQQLDEALAIQNSTGQKLGQALVSLGYLSDNALLQTLCADAGIPFLTETELQAQPDAVALIPAELARQHSVVPLKLESRHLVIAMADPFDLLSIRSLTRAAGRSVRVVGAQREAVLKAINVAYVGSAAAASMAAATAARVAAMGGGAPSHAPPKLELARGEARPAVRAGWPAPPPITSDDPGNAASVVDDILRRGVELGATDIHIEPLDEVIRIR